MEALGKDEPAVQRRVGAFAAPAVSDRLPLAAAPLDRLVALVRGAAESSCSEKFPIGAEIANGQAQIRALDITPARRCDRNHLLRHSPRRRRRQGRGAVISHTDTEMRFLMGDDSGARALLVAHAARRSIRGAAATPSHCRWRAALSARSTAAASGASPRFARAGGVALPWRFEPIMTARLTIVDDDPAFTDFLKTLLETHGYAVDVFHSGSGAARGLRAELRPMSSCSTS